MLLATGVLNWKDCLTYTPAWDTLFWFAVLVGMSGEPAWEQAKSMSQVVWAGASHAALKVQPATLAAQLLRQFI